MAQATVTIEGFTAKDAELRFTKQGQAALGFSVPVTPQKKTDNGWEDSGETVWYTCSIWGPLAELYANANMLAKGTRVKVTGNLTGETYNEKQQLRVKVEQVGFFESRKQSSTGFSQAPGQSAGNSTFQNAQNPAHTPDPWAAAGAQNPPF